VPRRRRRRLRGPHHTRAARVHDGSGGPGPDAADHVPGRAGLSIGRIDDVVYHAMLLILLIAGVALLRSAGTSSS
jgi:hypothetical protein